MSGLGKNFLKRCLTPVRKEERAEWLNEEESSILGRGSREQRPGSHSVSGADTQEANVAEDRCVARGRQSYSRGIPDFILSAEESEEVAGSQTAHAGLYTKNNFSNQNTFGEFFFIYWPLVAIQKNIKLGAL